MATLVQAYLGVWDAEMVELTVVQMVLDRLGAEARSFSQGAIVEFRDRLIRADMDRRLLERSVELAREIGGFDWRKLPRSLRMAVDSSPFEGAGRVEDTFNLLGTRPAIWFALSRRFCVGFPPRWPSAQVQKCS